LCAKLPAPLMSYAKSIGNHMHMLKRRKMWSEIYVGYVL